MLTFKKIGIEDRPLILDKLRELNCKLLNYNYVVMFIYQEMIHFEYALYHDFLIVKTCIEGKEQFLFPVGDGYLFPVLDKIKEYAFAREQSCSFFQFCEDNAKPLLEWAGLITGNKELQYKFYEVRDEFEYIYLSENLIRLEGSAYKPKRNHVNHFLKHYIWTEERIDDHNIQEVIDFSKRWDARKEIGEKSRLNFENRALYKALEHYKELGIEGLLLKIDGKVVAFSIGCPLCEDTYLVLFEKGNWEINGSYAMINKEFVRVIASNYKYINRAEDGGVPGLRKAKLSYNPEYLQKVYHLDIIKNEELKMKNSL